MGQCTSREDSSRYLPMKWNDVPVLVHEGRNVYRADNSLLQASSDGVGYCLSTCPYDFDGETVLKWGHKVNAVKLADGWIKVKLPTQEDTDVLGGHIPNQHQSSMFVSRSGTLSSTLASTPSSVMLSPDLKDVILSNGTQEVEPILKSPHVVSADEADGQRLTPRKIRLMATAASLAGDNDRANHRAREAEGRVQELQRAMKAEKEEAEGRMQELQRALKVEKEQHMVNASNSSEQLAQTHRDLENAQARAEAAESRIVLLEQQLEEKQQEGRKTERKLSKRLAGESWRHGVAQIIADRRRESIKIELENAEQASVSAIEVVAPLQQCIQDGDATELHSMVKALAADMDAGQARRLEVYGKFAEVVVPFFAAAQSKLKSWEDILATVRAVIKSVECEAPSRIKAKRLFSALREASITGLNIEKTDPESASKIVSVLLDFHVKEGCIGNSLQEEIVRRIAACTHFLEFDFTDMNTCLTFADKEETSANDFFLSRARALIASHEVHEFKDILSLLDTVIFFLRFLDKEDLALTYKKYRDIQEERWVKKYIDAAEKQYFPGRELVKTAGRDLHSQADLDDLFKQLHANSQTKGCETIDQLRPIVYSWAKVMMEKFNLLVLPHHTQVVCMLVCLEFIRGPRADLPEAGALIAEIGTGEGKSAVIAMLAIFCVAVLGKQVHVVVDDETLLERDFGNFRQLFAEFSALAGEPVVAHLCVSALRKDSYFKSDSCVQPYVDEAAHIVYCEAKHVQSFYTRLAKRGGTNFDAVYRNRVLFVDEVDALLIDEAPNVPFVYENDPLSSFATKVAEAFKTDVAEAAIDKMAQTPAEKKVLRSMKHAAKVASSWTFHVDYAFDEHANRYFRVQSGRVNEGAWSLALELKNHFADLIDHITYNERLFVMSRPRTIRKYSRIVGLSGSVGNNAERSFLRELYGAEFVKVPKFLTTCKGSVCHDAVPLGIHIEDNAAAQSKLICEKTLEARARTPVLIVAKDRHQANYLVEELQMVANARGLRGPDVVRSLSRDLYESNRDRFKENLFQFLQPCSKGTSKSFRVAVTDPRGGRGIDYRLTDPDADAAGGLTLVIQHIPKQSRDWIQYLGRTARQGCRGQWLAVLDRQDYADTLRSSMQLLDPETAVDTILSWGETEVKVKIAACHGQYHRGVRMNELCEQIAEQGLLSDETNRNLVANLCNGYEHMSIAQIDEAAAKIQGLSPQRIATEAAEVGAEGAAHAEHNLHHDPRSIIILLDRSHSMSSTDAGGGRSRFAVCKSCILDTFNNHIEDQDLVGLYSFEDKVRESFPLTQKGPHVEHLSELICNLPKPDGLTRFYDGVLECLEKLQASPSRTKYLIALTDGDDNMSQEQPLGEKVTAMLRAEVTGLNLILITCGRSVKPNTVATMRCWTETAKAKGNVGMYIPADRPAELVDVFAKVAELIDLEGEAEL